MSLIGVLLTSILNAVVVTLWGPGFSAELPHSLTHNTAELPGTLKSLGAWLSGPGSRDGGLSASSTAEPSDCPESGSAHDQ